jgi:hypothetical protein
VQGIAQAHQKSLKGNPAILPSSLDRVSDHLGEAV